MAGVALSSSHIYLDSALVEEFFRQETYALVAYDKKQQRLLISPASNQWFAKMHKPMQFLLKTRNVKGDKTLGIREILLDNDIDPADRPLTVEIVKRTGLLKVSLS